MIGSAEIRDAYKCSNQHRLAMYTIGRNYHRINCWKSYDNLYAQWQ